jgi:uncharacterized protein
MASLFRPQNSLHKQLSGFDFENAVYYFNVGEGPDHRHWENCRSLGFLSAGGGKQWRNQVLDIAPGDVLIAYLKGHGFVGVGKVTHPPRPFNEVRVKGKLLDEFGPSSAGMSMHSDDMEMCEYPILLDWVRAVPREEAKWKSRSGLYTTQLVKASLDNQPKTTAFVEREFKVNLEKLVR